MKQTYLAFLALLLVGISCKKSSSAPEAPQKYMSFAANSSWTYEIQNAITASVTTNTSTSTNRDSVILGKNYHVFTNSNGSPNEYYNITGDDYYTFRNLPAAAGIGPLETIYLKENAAVGVNWNQTVNFPLSGVPGTIPVVFTNTITEKGVTRTVNGIAYNNVIHITTTVAVTGLPAGSVVSDIQSYYAPKYGLIESRYKISLPLLTATSVDQHTILKFADIK
jgi:hypothetical protein